MWKNIVSLDWLREHADDPKVRIADCRFVLGSGNSEAGEAAYAKDHIPGAIYFHMERDLAGPKLQHGGRHPLPDVQELAAKLGQAGIDSNSVVVAYDDQGGAMAARFWWLLKYLGHPSVYILDEGYSAWKSRNYPVTQVAARPQGTEFIPQIQKERVVHLNEVKEKQAAGSAVLIDSRESKRYLGVEETVDPVAGHIPGAVNLFWKDRLNEHGGYQSAEAYQKQFESIPKDAEVIVYCGSGITACPNVLALEEAGYRNVKLYAGSFSDWCSYPENLIATDSEDLDRK